MNTKRSLWLVLCLILVMVVAACSNNTNNATTEKNAPASTPEKPVKNEKPAEKTKLSYWTNDRHDADFIKEMVDQYNATNKDNIEVELVVKTEEYDQAVDLSFATAETPDILRVKENTIQIFHAKGYLAPIDGYLTPELREKFPQVDQYNSFDGVMYSLPSYGTTLRLVYNKELFAKAGIANPPTNLAEMVDYAKRITEVGKADGAYGFAQNFKSPGSALGRSARVIAEVSGIGGFGYDFKTARFDFSGFEPIINAFKQMKDDGSTLPGMEALDIDPLRAQFAEGKLGMYLSFSSEPGVYKNQFPAKIEWAGAPVPSIDGTIKGASALLGGQWLAISSKSPNKDQAWKFMEYMYPRSSTEAS
jgi:multiple sugar transport system substrate-binding protein